MSKIKNMFIYTTLLMVALGAASKFIPISGKGVSAVEFRPSKKIASAILTEHIEQNRVRLSKKSMGEIATYDDGAIVLESLETLGSPISSTFMGMHLNKEKWEQVINADSDEAVIELTGGLFTKIFCADPKLIDKEDNVYETVIDKYSMEPIKLTTIEYNIWGEPLNTSKNIVPIRSDEFTVGMGRLS